MDLVCRGFTISGVVDRTQFNFLRQMVVHTCGKFLPAAKACLAPTYASATHFSTGDDGLTMVDNSEKYIVQNWLNYLYKPLPEKMPALKDALPAHAAGWLRKDEHVISPVPRSLSKFFVRVQSGFLPVRPLDRMITTGLIKDTGALNLFEYHAAIANSYAPARSATWYYDAFAAFRQFLAGKVNKSAAELLQALYGN